MACEKAKRVLSDQLETTIEVEALIDGIDFNEKLTRAKFEDLNKDLFAKTMNPLKQVLGDSKLEKSAIDVVCMVGGSTRIPKVKTLVSSFFEGKKLETEVNPDEAIGYGAAVEAAILNGEPSLHNIVVMDVTPLSLGIETIGGRMAKIIERNTPIPTEKSDIFTTTEDYQTIMEIPIYEGERPMTKYNRRLGELQFTDIPRAKKGIPEIKVLFKLNKNGILEVIVEDQQTKNKKHLQINKSYLNATEVEEMKKDAEKHAKEDEELAKATEARIRLENYIDVVKEHLNTKNIANRIKSQDKTLILNNLSQTSKWIRETETPIKKVIFKRLVDLKKLFNQYYQN